MCARLTHSNRARESRVGAAPLLPGPRQEARRPAARPNRLGSGRLASRPPAGLPGRLAGRGALPRAWAGEGRRRDARITAASAAPASPEERRRQILAFQLRALPLAGCGTRGKVNLSSKSREDAVSRSLLFILSLRLYVEGRSTCFLFSVFRCEYFPVDNTYAFFFFFKIKFLSEGRGKKWKLASLSCGGGRIGWILCV